MPAWDPVCLATEGIPSRFLRLRTSATLGDRPGVAGILVVRCPLVIYGTSQNTKNCFPASRQDVNFPTILGWIHRVALPMRTAPRSFVPPLP